MRLTLVGMNVFIVFALIRLGRWSEDWLGELFGLLEPGWHWDTVDSLTLFVFIPSGTWEGNLLNTTNTAPRSRRPLTSDVSSNDSFHLDDLAFPYDHTPALKLIPILVQTPRETLPSCVRLGLVPLFVSTC